MRRTMQLAIGLDSGLAAHAAGPGARLTQVPLAAGGRGGWPESGPAPGTVGRS